MVGDGMTDLGRQIGERAQAAAEPTLLDLVRQYALSLVRSSGLPTGESLRLWESIAALVPTLPVQARDANGMLWWIHGCGEVNGWVKGDRPGPFSCGTLGCTGPWRQLYVAPDAAPNGDRAPEVGEGDNWLDNPGEQREQRNAPECPAHGPHPHAERLCLDCPICWPPVEQPQPDIPCEIMAALGVDRAKDVLGAVAADRELITELLQQRDEAHAEIERIRGRWRNDAEIGDEYAAWADRLARAALKHTDVHETEEASGSEELWGLALDALTGKVRPDGRIVLRLPEPPPGTVALIGKLTGNSYVMHGGRWCFGSSAWTFSELLGHEGEVTVELAPEPEPQQPPTAAEVWRGLSDADRADARNTIGWPELAEALDREVAAEAQRRYVAERGAR